jgi:hypothetical protein
MSVTRVSEPTIEDRLIGFWPVRARWVAGSRRLLFFVPVLVLVFFAFSISSAFASSPWWQLSSRALPTVLAENGEGVVDVTAVNMGDAETTGPVTLSDRLPAGVTVQSVEFFATPFLNSSINIGFVCTNTSEVVSCVYPQPFFSEHLPQISLHVHPYENLEMRIKVKVEVGATSGESHAGVTGGEAPEATLSEELQVGSTPAGFGVENLEVRPEEEGGGIDEQAGSHPFQLSTKVDLNQSGDPAKPPALLRNVKVNLPPGMIGNAVALPQCSEQDFKNLHDGGAVDFCPSASAVGVAVLTVDEPLNLKLHTISVPVFNLVPARGEPARFGFLVVQDPVLLDTSVRTGGDYGVSVSVTNTSELANLISSTVAIWGVPGDPIHNEARGWGCLDNGLWTPQTGITCEPSTESHAVPFLTTPTSCTSAFNASIEATSWPTHAAEEGFTSPVKSYSLHDQFERPLSITGCNQLPFDPSLEVAPDGEAASTPTGLAVDVKVPQEVNNNGAGLSSSSVKDISVTFPEGVTVNPASADGLQACSESRVGFQAGHGVGGSGFEEFNPETEPGSKTALFTPTIGSPSCPNASKIGTVKLKVPVIKKPLEGALYLAAQNANPFGSLLATYIVAEDPESGVVVKLAGEVSLNPVTGQITSTFKNSPQAPLEEAEIHLFGGAQAPFSTPAFCRDNTPEHPGTYTTVASFDPWSGGASVSSSSSFNVTSGPDGSPCPGAALPFSPVLQAGTSNINAGAFSPLVTTIGREDGNQNINSVQLHTPPGLSGILTGVPLCPEAQANAGTCGQASLIGHTTVSVGLGNEPFTVVGGEVFLTEKYAGAPFGLSIVNPAVAGPFNLGKVVVRAKIEVDPHTAQLTITTGEIPHILDGIPLQIKHVNVTVDRARFTFNPTNCSAQQITGSIESVEGASSPVAVPFQVTNCASLKFAPKFAVSTQGKTSKANGASLTVKLTYPSAPFGSQANIKQVKVELPKQLPSRLTTLQKACTAVQFNTNPAGCPSASIIGHAEAITPLIPVPLEGPAYFVSNGGEAFPNLVLVLQGYGVRINLVGDTFISKAGVTSSTFKTVPDARVGRFELTLPEGKYSALAANGNLCTSKLTMPTEFVGQNGALLKQTTPVSVTGCAKTKALTRAQKLAKALKACKRDKNKGKRQKCSVAARKKYGPTARKKSAGKKSKR